MQDYKYAYRWVRINLKVVVTSVTPSPHLSLDLVILFLRMIFGETPTTNSCSCVFEIVTNLAIELLCFKAWDPKSPSSPLQAKLPKRKSLPKNVPFFKACETAVSIPIGDNGKKFTLMQILVWDPISTKYPKNQSTYSFGHSCYHPFTCNIRTNLLTQHDFIKTLLAKKSLIETKVFIWDISWYPYKSW